MKRRIAWATGATLLLGGGVIAAQGVSADEEVSKCSAATLRGHYLSAFSGFELRGSSYVPTAAAGYDVFHGNGKLTSVFTLSRNGKIGRNLRATGRYTVKSDCTGSGVYPGGISFDLFTSPTGDTFTFIFTTPKTAIAGSESKGTATRVSS